MEKASTINSDWTVYDINTETIRNWIIANDMTIVIRYNLHDEKAYYCVPEDNLNYWDLEDIEKNTVLQCDIPFNKQEIEKIMWQARVRHYDRLVRLTMPNDFENNNWQGIPQFKLFIHKFLYRIKLVNEDFSISDELFVKQSAMKAFLYNDMEFEDSEDMLAIDKALYASCTLMILGALEEHSGVKVGMKKFLVDQSSIVLFQLIKVGIKDRISNKNEETNNLP